MGFILIAKANCAVRRSTFNPSSPGSRDMQACTLAGNGGAEASRLLIYAAGDENRDRWSVESFIQRMRAHVLDGRRNERALLGLEIHDLQGHRVFALDDAHPLVEVVLRPGTYHVSTEHGGTRRRYTIALEQGASTDLYLRLALDRH
jgi:signal transduction histidine kinase